MDLAKVMIDTLGPKYNYKLDTSKITIIQKRAGEKLHEELMGQNESDYVFENNDMFIIYPNYLRINDTFEIPAGFKRTRKTYYSSRDEDFLSENKIASLINQIFSSSY